MSLHHLKRSLEAEHLYTAPTPHTPASHDDATLLCVFTQFPAADL
jgi:hypothetical protein